MKFTKPNWTNQDIKDLEKYLLNISRPNKIEWTKNIIQTHLPLLAIESKNLVSIAKQIRKGNYLEFLDKNTYSSYEITIISGYILNEEKNFSILKGQLTKYIKHIDCWASCDLLKFKTKYFEDELFNLALQFTKNPAPFTRRVGIKIMFSYLNNEKYINQIFETLNSFYDEKEYYVNMILSWLLCELFIKQRTFTLKFLNSNNQLNSFVLNHGIQKCRDSFRVSKEDKDMLLKYKKQ